jgi:hypothetical protein
MTNVATTIAAMRDRVMIVVTGRSLLQKIPQELKENQRQTNMERKRVAM